MKRKIIGICTLAGLLFFSCQKQDDLYTVGSSKGPKLSDIISFYKISPLVSDADSASLCTITVKINAEADINNRNVIVRASSGSFSNKDTTQTVQANSEGYATANLLSDSPGMVHIKATVLTYSIDTIINFVAALPDDILLRADNYAGDPSDTFNATTILFRNPGRGKTSDPVKVFYQIVSLDTSLNLVYPEFAYSSKQKASVEIINPYQIKGRFNITSKALSSKGDTLSKKIMIVIK